MADESAHAEKAVLVNEEYVIDWETAYYVLSNMFGNAKIHISYAPLTVLYQEAIAALRASFLVNERGHHSDAISLLRRVHECAVKGIASRINPTKMWKYIESSSLQGPENEIGISLKDINRIESSFVHSNKLRVYKAGHAAEEKDLAFERIGAVFDPKLFNIAANLSILWFFVLISTAPKVFQKQKHESWTKDSIIVCKNLKAGLGNMPGDRFLRIAEAFEGLIISK